MTDESIHIVPMNHTARQKAWRAAQLAAARRTWKYISKRDAQRLVTTPKELRPVAGKTQRGKPKGGDAHRTKL